MTPTPEEPTALERFTTDATKRATLYALLRDPVLAEAIDIAQDLMRPKAGTTADANHVLAVSKFQQSAGADEFMRLLRGMTRESKPLPKLTPRKLATSVDDLPKTPES